MYPQFVLFQLFILSLTEWSECSSAKQESVGLDPEVKINPQMNWLIQLWYTRLMNTYCHGGRQPKAAESSLNGCMILFKLPKARPDQSYFPCSIMTELELILSNIERHWSSRHSCYHPTLECSYYVRRYTTAPPTQYQGTALPTANDKQ